MPSSSHICATVARLWDQLYGTASRFLGPCTRLVSSAFMPYARWSLSLPVLHRARANHMCFLPKTRLGLAKEERATRSAFLFATLCKSLERSKPSRAAALRVRVRHVDRPSGDPLHIRALTPPSHRSHGADLITGIGGEVPGGLISPLNTVSGVRRCFAATASLAATVVLGTESVMRSICMLITSDVSQTTPPRRTTSTTD